MDTVLPFGLRSASIIFTAITDALQWILEMQGVKYVMHYLDDFLLFRPPWSSICREEPDSTLEYCSHLGGPVAAHKTEGPTSSITFLDPSVHLSHEDIAVDNPVKPQVVRITIKQSKAYPFHKGVDPYLGRTFVDLCPVISLLNYLLIANVTREPLFRFKDGQLITRQQLVLAVKEALQKAGIDQSKYNGHSFINTAATTAAAKGMEDSIIKTLRRWSSVADLQYVKISKEQLASYSSLLCS